MANQQLRLLIFPVLLICILSTIAAVKCDTILTARVRVRVWLLSEFNCRECPKEASCSAGEEDNLLQGINSYRTSLNLTTLLKNENAKCLAEELADQFKDQPCTNTTGANTIPGTENQLPNYPTLLEKCHLNVSTTRDGTIMPACVPNLVPSLVLSNYTQSSQYSRSLNDTKYTGIGIGSENDWIVVILTTDTPEGGYSPAASDNTASLSSQIPFNFWLLFLLVGSLFLL